MVLPWELIGTAVAAVAAGWVLLRLRVDREDRDAAFDLVFTVALSALVLARLLRVGFDVASAGTAALDVRAVLTLGSGLSTSAAVLGGLAGGWWHARRHSPTDAQWRAATYAGATGLAVWSALAFVRDEMVGIAGLPVAAIEAVLFAAAAWWFASTNRWSGARRGAAFAVTVTAVHLMGSLLRPTLPTFDADVEMALGIVSLGVAVLAVRAVSAKRVGAAVGVGLSVVVGLVAAAVSSEEPSAVSAAGEPAVEADLLAGALSAGDEGGAPPVFGADELAAFVAGTGDRPVVVNFWASWCPPCRAEAPALARSARALGDEVAFLGVNVDDTARGARDFVERYDLPFPTVRDGGLRQVLGMRGLPTTVVLRSDGTVAARIVGGLDAGSLASAVDRARR